MWESRSSEGTSISGESWPSEMTYTCRMYFTEIFNTKSFSELSQLYPSHILGATYLGQQSEQLWKSRSLCSLIPSLSSPFLFFSSSFPDSFRLPDFLRFSGRKMGDLHPPIIQCWNWDSPVLLISCSCTTCSIAGWDFSVSDHFSTVSEAPHIQFQGSD